MSTTNELFPIRKTFTDGSSRFRRWPILQENGSEFFSTYYSHTYPFSPSDIYHEVSAGEEGRLDLISHQYYGTSLLWWVIAEANDLFNVWTEVTSGKVLRIPSTSYVLGTRLA